MQEIEDFDRHWKDERQETWEGDLRAFPYEGQCNTRGTETQMRTILTSKSHSRNVQTKDKQGNFGKVPDDEPITCCSSLVVQLKPKFAEVPPGKLEPKMIRASVDLRVRNQYMERSRIAQATVLEDFTHKFHDCSICTK